jgi:alkanesulfonate monooxygenase
MSARPIRFGVWAVVNGSWASFHHPADPPDASWQRNRDLVLEAERLGFASTLVAQQTINPWKDSYDQLEAWTASAGLAAITERIEIITAIKPALQHPVMLAKQALQIQAISGGRFSINLVNGWFKPEVERAGIPFLEHDDRYSYGREWIEVVRELMDGQRVTFAGRHFDIRDYQLRPGPVNGVRPAIYFGGESEPARALAAAFADIMFINGRPVEDVVALVADMRRRPRAGAPLRFALAGFVIARPTDAEADAALCEALVLAAEDAEEIRGMAHNTDPHVVTQQIQRRYGARIGTNGGTAAGLVGGYDTVAARIARFAAAGIETFMLQFQPFEAEMRRFAAEVMPRVHRLTEAG